MFSGDLRSGLKLKGNVFGVSTKWTFNFSFVTFSFLYDFMICWIEDITLLLILF